MHANCNDCRPTNSQHSWSVISPLKIIVCITAVSQCVQSRVHYSIFLILRQQAYMLSWEAERERHKPLTNQTTDRLSMALRVTQSLEFSILMSLCKLLCCQFILLLLIITIHISMHMQLRQRWWCVLFRYCTGLSYHAGLVTSLHPTSDGAWAACRKTRITLQQLLIVSLILPVMCVNPRKYESIEIHMNWNITKIWISETEILHVMPILSDARNAWMQMKINGPRIAGDWLAAVAGCIHQPDITWMGFSILPSGYFCSWLSCNVTNLKNNLNWPLYW